MASRRAQRAGLITGTTAFVGLSFMAAQQMIGPESGPEFVGAPAEAKASPEEDESQSTLLCLALDSLRRQLGPEGESSYSISTDPDGSGGAGIYTEAEWVEAAADTLEGVLFRSSGPVGQYGPMGPPAVSAAEDSHAAVPFIVAEREAAGMLDPRDTWGGAYQHTPARLAAVEALDAARESTDHALNAAMCDPVDV